ncbi:MAG: response regulator [Flavobacteriaceae bacterium]|nr:response regulator [Flavobacteriaceae bacterium]
MSLSELKTSFVNKRIQQLEVSEMGLITSSDNVIFHIAKDTQLSTLHPFLEATQYLLPSITQNINFPCVNLEIDSIKKIVDVEIIRKKEQLYILLFDFTEHYEASHPLVQEKNENSIAKNKLDFEKRLLLAKAEFKNSFLSNLNHEIRNPLNNMLGFIDLLAETKLNYDQYETIKIIRKTGTHIKMLMEDMLDISKIERGIFTVKDVNFYLTSIISSLQQHFSLKYNSKNVGLVVDIVGKVPKTLVGDPVRLNQILFNLLENAFRNTKEGSVTLKVYSEDTSEKRALVHFEISDTGVGIPEESLAHVFDSYYQLKLDKEKPIGEGLGLKIVKDLVGLLDGKITVSNRDKQGAVFLCSLPFEKRKSKREKKTIKKGSGIYQSKRILIVEDKPDNQMLFMKTFLNNDKGYVIEIASNAAQAYDLLENRKYDLVISKNTLSDEDGVTFIQKLQQHSSKKIASIPILVASGSTMILEQQEFLNAGAAHFLPKPYTKKELFKCIEKLIR